MNLNPTHVHTPAVLTAVGRRSRERFAARAAADPTLAPVAARRDASFGALNARICAR